MPPLARLDGQEHFVYGILNDQRLSPGEKVGKGWSIDKSSLLYNVDKWGAPYFFINEKGDMAVRPHGKATRPSEEIDVMAVVQEIVESKIFGRSRTPLPLIIRFPDILRDRLETLQSAFETGINAHSYQGRYRGVFPVKCNQDRYVLESIVEFGRPHGFGLEAGSKPELLLAITCLCRGSPESLLICNGYKDAEYVGLALTATHLGLNCVIVLEQQEELEIVTKMSQELSIEPVLGLRAKLQTKHGGHFGETSGEKGKFGLSSSQIIETVDKLRERGMLHCLQLLHFHVGSQIPSLAVLDDGVSEAAHIFCELALMGANMKCIDVGGGLGIDYDGLNSSRSDMSVDYTIEEYADQVVMAVQKACRMKKVKHPILCSESGRALVSHHSVLVFDVLSVQDVQPKYFENPLEVRDLPEGLALIYRNMGAYSLAGEYRSSLECAKQMKAECTHLFKRGELSLLHLATIQNMHEVLSALVNEKLPVRLERERYDDGDEMPPKAVYHVNLSIFKSMPDTWAINQLFPIVPLHRLEEKPMVHAILSDLTCDSDGRIKTFVGTDPKKGNFQRLQYLPVHSLERDKPYYIGMFLGGAYQEALGSLHNLFGKTNVVHVVQQQPQQHQQQQQRYHQHRFRITHAISGQTAADVLRAMQHDPEAMFQELKSFVEKRFQEGAFKQDREAAIEILGSLAYSFSSFPYLNNDSGRGSFQSPTVHLNSNGKAMVIGSHALEQAYCCT